MSSHYSSFRFGLQPALDAAAAEQLEWERTVAETRQNVGAEQARLDAMHEEMRQLVQRLAKALDNLSAVPKAPPAYEDLKAAADYVQGLRLQRETQGQAISGQEVILDDARLKLQIQTEELQQVVARVRALERLRERQFEEFRDELLAAERKALDEIATQRSGTGR